MKLLVANWKMAPETVIGARTLAKTTHTLARTYKKHLTTIACTPFVYLSAFREVAKGLHLGAQTVAAGAEVASTGQISAAMLKSLSVTYAIVGHSECRAAGDSDELVKAKIDRLLEKKITPIICVGEKTRDDQGWYLSVIKDQVESALRDIPKATIKRLIIAYEPVWAIGAKAERQASPVECREMVMFVRKLIADLTDEKTARAVTILYGGSVDETNAPAFVTDGEADGLLAGRVSLDAKRFAKLAKAVVQAIS